MNALTQKVSFSKNLARLFYAIAATDKRVHEAEVRSMKRLIQTSWSDILEQKNNEPIDQIYQIELEFKRLVEENSDPIECFNDFIDFKEKNQAQFDQDINELIWKTSNAIVHAFSGKNKSELILLTKLKMNLQQ